MERFTTEYKAPYTFASSADALVSDIGTGIGDGLSVNFPSGIPPVYSILPANGGKYFERGIVNSIGKMASMGPYMSQIGYMYTYEPDVADAIGGYPKGAILRYTDATGNTQLVQSCIANNSNNFVSDPSLIDGKKWIVISTQDISPITENIFPSYNEFVFPQQIYNDPAIPFFQWQYSTARDLATIKIPYDCRATLSLFYRLWNYETRSGIENARTSPMSYFVKSGVNYYRLSNTPFFVFGTRTPGIIMPDYYDVRSFYFKKDTEIVLRCDLGGEWTKLWVIYTKAHYVLQKVEQP